MSDTRVKLCNRVSPIKSVDSTDRVHALKS